MLNGTCMIIKNIQFEPNFPLKLNQPYQPSYSRLQENKVMLVSSFCKALEKTNTET